MDAKDPSNYVRSSVQVAKNHRSCIYESIITPHMHIRIYYDTTHAYGAIITRNCTPRPPSLYHFEQSLRLYCDLVQMRISSLLAFSRCGYDFVFVRVQLWLAHCNSACILVRTDAHKLKNRDATKVPDEPLVQRNVSQLMNCNRPCMVI